MFVAVAIPIAAYLIGAIPFSYLIARAKGIDLSRVGSGNIGATNVARALGKKYGVAAFFLDFVKGAVPVAAAVPVAGFFDPTAPQAFGHESVLRVLAALLAFLGHLFPVYLKFKGGKGVATGAGAVAVLVPVPFVVAVLTWVSVTLATRFVSAGSIASVIALVVVRLLETRTAFAYPEWVVTTFCLAGAAVVIIKHRANVRRLFAGTENAVGDGPMRHTFLRGLHLLAIGLWCGSGVFFNFIAAVPIFDSFKEVVKNQPSDRTGFIRILPENATEEDKAALASGLAGSAVGPLFPRFFVLSALCAVAAVASAYGFTKVEAGRVHRMRLVLCLIAAGLVAFGWPVSDWVSKLRVERFHPDDTVRTAAKAAFGVWHLISLASGGVTTLVTLAILCLGAKLPNGHQSSGSTEPPKSPIG
ncbi:MAG: glycerol-3-phosphate 1-O-acyltransferase PlsY [Fimbriiglobus sp.]|nr:glycerol-3-phosphate 1-O-acyltransferase PlsY [Fimbriiglobus sp.]